MPVVRVPLFLSGVRMHHVSSVPSHPSHHGCTTDVGWIHHRPLVHGLARFGAVARAFHPLVLRRCCSIHRLDRRRIRSTPCFGSTSSSLPRTARCRLPSIGWRVQSTMDPLLCKSHPNARLCRVVLPNDGKPLQLQACRFHVLLSIASEGMAHVHVQTRRCARSNRVESRNVPEGIREPGEKKLTLGRRRHTSEGTDTPPMGRRGQVWGGRGGRGGRVGRREDTPPLTERHTRVGQPGTLWRENRWI